MCLLKVVITRELFSQAATFLFIVQSCGHQAERLDIFVHTANYMYLVQEVLLLIVQGVKCFARKRKSQAGHLWWI